MGQAHLYKVTGWDKNQNVQVSLLMLQVRRSGFEKRALSFDVIYIFIMIIIQHIRTYIVLSAMKSVYCNVSESTSFKALYLDFS